MLQNIQPCQAVKHQKLEIEAKMHKKGFGSDKSETMK